MAKKTDYEGDTALQDAPATTPTVTRSEARERFINRCLHDWARDQFLGERGCDPNEGHVDKLVEKAGRLFDRLFAKRPITSNL